MHISWLDLHQQALSVPQLYAVLALRCEVFVVEQQCAYLDVDGQDLQGENRHLLGMAQDDLLAYARILSPRRAETEVKIGRVIISSKARGLNLGNQLMMQAIASCEQHWPRHAQFLSAQAHLAGFYQRHGFLAVSDSYLEDGIPHIDMRRAGGNKPR
ncbi:GNAT family N-acetyltransferase [Pantoea stewartii]|uniref:GNAT family N-acetyltransferase n=1 Tax=Pantoea stewartii TaxID=66269 RepID=UPI0019825045|nr:GNAT family N-acetyltransferase [Pantoea stewartii]